MLLKLKNCGSCTKFLNFWNWNKIEPAKAKFQAWVLGRKSSKSAIVARDGAYEDLSTPWIKLLTYSSLKMNIVPQVNKYSENGGVLGGNIIP